MMSMERLMNSMEMNMRKLILLSVVALCSSCQTWGPTWSEVTGALWNKPPVEFSVAPTSVQTVDGKGAFPLGGAYAYVKMTPGPHTLVLAAAPLTPGWRGGTDLETMQLNAEPCMRYYIAAKYDTRLSASWKPFIDYVESIAGCSVTAAK
jgi:hypothetical protein